METQVDLLSPEDLKDGLVRRRKLLPWWVKVFIWIFFLFGAIVPVVVVMGMMNAPVVLSFYGIDSNDAFSLTGLCLTGVFALKAVVSFGLWMEKDWGVSVAIADGVLGLVICLYTMGIGPLINSVERFNGTMRIEPLILVIYLFWLWKVRPSWKRLIKIRLFIPLRSDFEYRLQQIMPCRTFYLIISAFCGIGPVKYGNAA